MFSWARPVRAQLFRWLIFLNENQPSEKLLQAMAASGGGETVLLRTLSRYSLFLLGLFACSSPEVNDANPSQFGNFGTVNVIETLPKDEAQGVARDTQFILTFDRKVDAYSAIPENFELWDVQGNRVGGKAIVSTKFVEHPNQEDKQVSQIRVRFEERLNSYRNYFFLWGGPQGFEDDPNSEAFGIRSLNGHLLPAGAIDFQTGEEIINQSPNEHLEILSATPGRILSRGRSFDFDDSLEKLVGRGESGSYITVAKDTDISLRFSEPIVDILHDQELLDEGLSELEKMDIEDFPHMRVAVFDQNISYHKTIEPLLNGVTNGEFDIENWPQYWEEFLDEAYGQVPGTVRTTENRRRLIFEPKEDCQDEAFCGYPDSPFQVVVVAVAGLRSYDDFDKKLIDDIATTVFFHSGGIKLPTYFLTDLFMNNEEDDGS